MNRLTCFGLLALLFAGCGGGDEGSGAANPIASGGGGPDPFDPNIVASYEITMDPAAWNHIVQQPMDDTWQRATVRWQGETWPNVAIRPSGHRSREEPSKPGKPSLRLEFDEFVPGREFHGYENIKLDSLMFDPTFMHERLAYDTYAARGVPTPRYAYCRVYVNGSYNGLYAAEERINKEFVTKRFGKAFNQIYDWTRAVRDFFYDPNRGPEYYVPFMLAAKVESLPPDAEGVRALVDILNNQPVEIIGQRFDIASFLEFMAVEVVIGEGDGYNGGVYDTPVGENVRSGNFQMYKVPGTGWYMLIPWDRDQSYWRGHHGIVTGFETRILTRRLILERPENFSRHQQILRELLSGPHATGLMHSRIDAIAAQIRQAAWEDPHYTDNFDFQVGGLKSYIQERNDSMRAQLGM